MRTWLFTLFVLTVIASGFGFSALCDPAIKPFRQILEEFETSNNIAVEGCYISANKFFVTKSSDKKITAGKAYDIFEYGPFGSRCEEYEMEASVEEELFSRAHLLLLILDKKKTTRKKLVTEIMQSKGSEIDPNRMITFNEEMNHASGDYETRLSAPVNEVWKQLRNGNAAQINWKRTAVSK